MSLFTLCTVELCPHKDCFANKAAAMSYDFQTLENTYTHKEYRTETST